jgi:phage tail-like protein
MSIFPLVQPVLPVNFFVTMWDTPDSNAGGVGGVLATVGTAVLNTAVGFLAGGFSAVEGLEASSTLEPYAEGGNDSVELQFFKRAAYPKIVLKRGVTFKTDIWDWHHQVITGKRKLRKSGTIIVLDQRKIFDIPGEDLAFEHFPVGAWTFHNALPEKLAGPALAADSEDTVAVEALELRAEKIERLSLALIPGVSDINSALSGLIGVGGAAAGAGLTAGLSAVL